MRAVFFTSCVFALFLLAYSCDFSEQCSCNKREWKCFDSVKQETCLDKCERHEECRCIGSTCRNFYELAEEVTSPATCQVRVHTDVKAFTPELLTLFGNIVSG